MSKFVFEIRLKKPHDAKGLSAYTIHKMTGIATNTIAKYAHVEVVEQRRLDDVIAVLCDFYGVDFHDVVTIKKSRMMAAM